MKKRLFTAFLLAATVGLSVAGLGLTFSSAEETQAVSDVFVKSANCVSVTDSLDYKTGYLSKKGTVIEGSGNVFSFNYKNKIPTRLMTRDMSVMDMSVVYSEGNDAVTALEFILTDSENPDNKVGLYWTYAGNIYDSHDACYAIGNYNGQYRGKMDEDSDVIFSGKTFGYAFYGRSLNAANKSFGASFGFSFDYKEMKLGVIYNSFCTVLDLDDKKQVGASVWQGFEGDAAYLSVNVYTRKGGTAAVAVEKLFGVDMTGDFGEEKKVSPTIYYDYGEMDKDDMPFAAKGYDYTLPFASGFDWYYGESAVSVTATLGAAVTPVSDFVFKPEEAGEYVIGYSVLNGFSGNKKTETLDLLALDKIPQINIWTDVETTPVIDCYFRIPDYRIAGGLGKLGAEISVFYAGVQTGYTSGDYILLDRAEPLVVSVKATGYVGEPYTKNFIYNIADRNEPFTVNGVPQYALYNCELVLPEITAYKSGLTTEISVNGGKADSLTIPKTAVTEDLNVVYSVKDGETVYNKAFFIQTIRPSGREDYFIKENGGCEVSVSEGGAVIDFNSAAEQTVVKMPFAVSMNGCALNFSAEGYDLNSLDVIITDSEYGGLENFLRFYYKDRTTSYMQINGTGEKFTVNGGLGSGDRAFSFIIDGYNSSLMTPQEEVITDKLFIPSKAAYIAFRANGVKNAGAKITVKQVANQLLFASDNAAVCTPVKYMPLNADCHFGNEIEIPKMRLFDVLSTPKKAFMTVSSLSGKTVYSGEAKALRFTADEYGYYYVKYFETAAMKKAVGSYVFRVIDDVSPVITLKGELESEIKLGKRYSLPEFSVTDNFDAEPTVFTVAHHLNSGRKTVIADGNYTFDRAGKYRIEIVAIDKSGNTTVFSQEVTVNEK